MQTKENFNYKHAKSSWMSAADDFKLVAHAGDIGVAEGNIDEMMNAGSFAEYSELIGSPPKGQGNFQAFIPFMYETLNGIELYIKACEYVAYPERVPQAIRKFPELLAAWSGAAYPKDQVAQTFISKYTGTALPALLGRFLAASGKQTSDLFSIRRYVSHSNFARVMSEYKPLFYTVDEGREFFAELLKDVTPMLANCVELQGCIDDDGNPNEQILDMALE